MIKRLEDLDPNQLFTYAGTLWEVQEIIPANGGRPSGMSCRPLTDTRRGSKTISSWFRVKRDPILLPLDAQVTVFDTQSVKELERHG